ncbi:MAG: hypothetical protein QOF11_1701 [Chloroflexota bacterium]|nr:hypothetical protein [Chloroflexota bacterium]
MERRPRTAIGVVGIFVGAALLAVVLASLSAQPASVSGFPIGAPADCSKPDIDCADAVRAAKEALGAREPQHAPIRTAVVHLAQLPNGVHRSGTLYVVLFDLEDGSQPAAGASCGVGACAPVASYQ